MSFKIAIASTDGKVVDEHFGRAEQFYIVEADVVTGDYKFIELRNIQKNNLINAETNHNQVQGILDQLSDVTYVLVSQIGARAEQNLRAVGITAFAVSQEISLSVTKIIEYNRRIKKR